MLNPIWNLSILPGRTGTITQNGTSFEFLVQTGPCKTRTSTRGKGFSPFSQYPNGTGAQGQAFDLIEIFNLSSVPIVVSVAVGDDNFINRQLVIANAQFPQIVYPTYPTVNAATSVPIPDISGSEFFDINGNKWLAIQRIAILVTNPDSATSFLIQQFASVISNGPAVIEIFPEQNLQLPFSGDYMINTGGAPINAIVSEIYQSIPAT